MNVVESPVIAKLHGVVTGGSGPDLAKYPHLVYAPAQWGEGVRLASYGDRVEDVASAADDRPILDVCVEFEIGMDEVVDALRYCQANNLI